MGMLCLECCQSIFLTAVFLHSKSHVRPECGLCVRGAVDDMTGVSWIHLISTRRIVNDTDGVIVPTHLHSPSVDDGEDGLWWIYAQSWCRQHTSVPFIHESAVIACFRQ